MKDKVILAVAMLLLISGSVVFYYNNVDFSNGKENETSEKLDLAYVEVPKIENEIKEEKKNNDSWFDGLFKKDDIKEKEDVVNNEEVKRKAMKRKKIYLYAMKTVR